MYGYQNMYPHHERVLDDEQMGHITAFEYFQKPLLPSYPSELARPMPKQANRFLQQFQDETGRYDIDKIFDTIDDIFEIAKQYVPWLLELLFIILYMKDS